MIPVILALILVLVFVLSTRLALSDRIAFDDDAGTTPAELDASDWIEGGDEPVVINGELPRLLCIDSGLYDVFGTTALAVQAAGAGYSRYQLLPPTWAEPDMSFKKKPEAGAGFLAPEDFGEELPLPPPSITLVLLDISR